VVDALVLDMPVELCLELMTVVGPDRSDAKRELLDDLGAWLRAQLPKISGKTPLAGAIR